MTILGNISNGFEKFMRVREKQAQMQVHAYLSSLDDTTLANYGYKRSDLKTGGRVNPFL